MGRPYIYPLPSFLAGRVTQQQYSLWLEGRTKWLYKRDRKRGKPYAKSLQGINSINSGRPSTKNGIRAFYKSLIHLAVVNCGPNDPYTGEKLSWELIGTWTNTNYEERLPDSYGEKYALMPTVDHRDPDVLEFEICSWKINDAKGDLDPKEFIALCRCVARHSSNKIVYSNKS